MKSRSSLFFVVVSYILFFTFNETLNLASKLFNGGMGIIPVLQEKRARLHGEWNIFLNYLDLCNESEVEKFLKPQIFGSIVQIWANDLKFCN